VPNLILPRSWGRTKPPSGTPLNAGCPLARGLVSFLGFCEGADFPRDSVTSNTIVGVAGSGDARLIWRPTPYGYGANAAGATTGNPYYYLSGSLLSGLSSWTIASHFFYPSGGFATANTSLGLNRWETGATHLLNRWQSTTSIRAIATLSTTSADLAINPSSIFVQNAVNCVTWRLTNSVLSCFVNGVLQATTATGNGTQTANSTWYEFGSATTASQVNMAGGFAVSSAVWNRSLTAAEAAQYARDPWSLFSPPPQIVFFESSGEAPTFKPAWAVNSNVMIG
jgi:hypothetical protein